MNRYKYTEDNPLKVFTAFSGYDSQCLALDRIGIPDKKSVIPIGYGVPDAELKQTRISDSQQYKMAGNSIVVACLSGIFENLFTQEEVIKETLF